ncbi:MAG: hypothetical protein KC548_05295, partial [Nanoarchaeota archaeon]|nr:hypothetical protein [Nanoarchaeota archaeon]
TVEEVTLYKNEETKEIKFIDVKYKPITSEIDSSLKAKSKSLNKGEKIYSILQFNKNPSKEEIKG